MSSIDLFLSVYIMSYLQCCLVGTGYVIQYTHVYMHCICIVYALYMLSLEARADPKFLHIDIIIFQGMYAGAPHQLLLCRFQHRDVQHGNLGSNDQGIRKPMRIWPTYANDYMLVKMMGSQDIDLT